MTVPRATTSIKAGSLPATTLPVYDRALHCKNYIDGFCRMGDLCNLNHELCLADDENREPLLLSCAPNYLSLGPRRQNEDFEDDGQGLHGDPGPRHNNDYVDIQDIRILPTTDEILSLRPPYIPVKDPLGSHRLPLGQARLLDTDFRQLRYENVEMIIDCCYHASQQLCHLAKQTPATDYDDRMRTPKGSRYSLFRDIAFEEILFNQPDGIMMRVSFACPSGLRGSRMTATNHMEEGMLVALVGLEKEESLSVTFMEIHLRQTTEAMKRRTGNDLRASAILSFANHMDVAAIRRLLYNTQGLLNEQFVLVEIPNSLYAGFRWTLQQLQRQSSSCQKLAFVSTIAPSAALSAPETTPPGYSLHAEFKFQLDILRQPRGPDARPALTLRPAEMVSDQKLAHQMIQRVCEETPLDKGQATALCETLCRSLAFTQGPPGTGKTFLGVALARVLLASRPPSSHRPILVACMTNHALDSFLGGLREAGILSLARLGTNSKEDWTKQFQIRNLSTRFKKTSIERQRQRQAHHQVESLATEGTSWCEALNNAVLSWPAVRDFLRAKHSDILLRFTEVEKTNASSISDIRLARKAGGFAFEYWCQGGDIDDIDLLLEKFSTMLGNSGLVTDSDPRDVKTLNRVLENIKWQAAEARDASVDADIWKLALPQRERLLQQWKQEINIQSILDRTVEVHRRHQMAVERKRRVYDEVDTRMLEDMDVVAMTTTACAQNWSKLEALGFKTVICEEAGEVMEAQFLCTLFPSVEHAISIGDPLQLRPQVNERCLSLETLAGSAYRLDESLMERLMLPTSSGVEPIPSSRLHIQRRMHPEIADLMRATLYPYLEDHESTSSREPVAGLADRIWWLDHQVAEDTNDSKSPMATSSSNAYEVKMVAGMVEYLVNSNEYDYKDITVLTPYNGQLAALTERLKGVCSLWLSDKDREALMSDGLLNPEDLHISRQTNVDLGDMLRLATVDNFQGEESKVVILSTVRSNNAGRVGFMKMPNRINVACSRARNGFYIGKLAQASALAALGTRKTFTWSRSLNNGTLYRDAKPCVVSSSTAGITVTCLAMHHHSTSE